MINFTNQWKIARKRKPRCNPSIVAGFAVLWSDSFYSSTSPIRYLAQQNNIHLDTIVLIFLFPPKKVQRNQPHCASFLLRINLNLPLLFRFELLSPCSTTSITLCIYCLSSPAGDLSVLWFDCQPAECRSRFWSLSRDLRPSLRQIIIIYLNNKNKFSKKKSPVCSTTYSTQRTLVYTTHNRPGKAK